MRWRGTPPPSLSSLAGIFAITNILNGKQYIGSAVNLARRWLEHQRHLSKGSHHSPPLQRAWNKYGPDAFAFSVLEYLDDATILIEREQHHMDARFAAMGGTGYNARPRAKNNLGYRRSVESRKALSECYKGRKITWGAKLRGPKSEEHRRKLSENAKKRRQTPESNARRSATLKGRPKNARLSELSRETRRRNILATHTQEARAKALATRASNPPTPKQLAYWSRKRKLSAPTQQSLFPDEV